MVEFFQSDFAICGLVWSRNASARSFREATKDAAAFPRKCPYVNEFAPHERVRGGTRRTLTIRPKKMLIKKSAVRRQSGWPLGNARGAKFPSSPAPSPRGGEKGVRTSRGDVQLNLRLCYGTSGCAIERAVVLSNQRLCYGTSGCAFERGEYFSAKLAGSRTL